MDLLQIVLITIQLSTVLTKKKFVSSSDESIENLLYYKDCQKKPKPKEEPKPEPVNMLRQQLPSPSQFECQFPKMCCSLSCNNECGGNNQQTLRQETPMSPQFPPMQPQNPVQHMQTGHKKKTFPPFPPIGGRRDFGFTKEKIKSLIAKDDDIRKILKDLVRVTMQKVDLVEMINSRRNAMMVDEDKKENKNLEISYSDDDYDLE